MSAVAKALRAFGDKCVHRKVLAAYQDKEFAKQVMLETSASDDACESVGTISDIIAVECGLESKWLPLGAAVVVVIGALTPYYFVIADANKKIRQRDRAEAHPAGSGTA
jgi:hypothetical protein